MDLKEALLVSASEKVVLRLDLEDPVLNLKAYWLELCLQFRATDIEVAEDFMTLAVDVGYLFFDGLYPVVEDGWRESYL